MRTRKVKCQWCSKEGSSNKFISYTTENGLKAYFCSHECMELINKDFLESKYLIIEIIDQHVTKSGDTYISNQLKEYDDNELNIVRKVLEENKNYYKDLLSKKNFNNIIVKLKYLFVALKDKVEKEKRIRTFNNNRWKESEQIDVSFEELKVSVIRKVRDVSNLFEESDEW